MSAEDATEDTKQTHMEDALKTVEATSKHQTKDCATQLSAAKAQEEVNLVVALRMYRQVSEFFLSVLCLHVIIKRHALSKKNY